MVSWRKQIYFLTNEVFITKRYKKPVFALLFLAFCLGSGWMLCRSGFFAALHSIQALQDYIRSFSPYSHLCFFLVQLLSVIFAPIPSNISAAAGGILFGTLPSFLLTFSAVLLGSTAVFLASRILGRPFADRLVSQKLSLKYQDLLHAKTDIFLILAFLFPFFPDDVLCILAGLSPIPPLRFFLIVLFTRPWGLLFASALGGASLNLPLWSMAVFGLAGLLIFCLGMKYGDRVEKALLTALPDRKTAISKKIKNF